MPTMTLILPRLAPIIICFLQWQCQNAINIKIHKVEQQKVVSRYNPHSPMLPYDNNYLKHFSQTDPYVQA